MTISKPAFIRLLIIIALIFATLGAMASEQGDAEKAVARGWTALEESNSDTAKSVDAALAFTEALNYYRSVGEMDTCQELQANIFWAKKRMNADDLATYLAAKGHESAPALVKVMDEVVDQKIEATEADKYFADAEAFAKKKPTEHLKIAIRYFEVASRFPGTAVSLEAQQRSLAAQGKAKIKTKAAKAPAQAAVVAGANTAKPIRDDTQKGKYVVLYTEPDYKGTKVLIPVPCSVDVIMNFGFPNDALRSIQIPRGVTVDLYEHEYSAGGHWTVTECTSDLTGTPRVGTTSLTTKRAKP